MTAAWVLSPRNWVRFRKDKTPIDGPIEQPIGKTSLPLTDSMTIENEEHAVVKHSLARKLHPKSAWKKFRILISRNRAKTHYDANADDVDASLTTMKRLVKDLPKLKQARVEPETPEKFYSQAMTQDWTSLQPLPLHLDAIQESLNNSGKSGVSSTHTGSSHFTECSFKFNDIEEEPHGSDCGDQSKQNLLSVLDEDSEKTASDSDSEEESESQKPKWHTIEAGSFKFANAVYDEDIKTDKVLSEINEAVVDNPPEDAESCTEGRPRGRGISCLKTSFESFAESLDSVDLSMSSKGWCIGLQPAISEYGSSSYGTGPESIAQLSYGGSFTSNDSFTTGSSSPLSPAGRCGTRFADGTMTLSIKQVQRQIRHAKPGDVIDLGGCKATGEGHLVINSQGITVRNGAICADEGIIVRAPSVKLVNLTLSSTMTEACTVKVISMDCTLQNCDITSEEGGGLLVEGLKSSVQVLGSKIHDCYSNCVWALRGGQIELDEACDIWGSDSFHGVAAENPGSVVKITSSKIHENHQDGVLATTGARVEINNCEIWGSAEYHGVSVKRQAIVTLVESKIYDNPQTCVYAGPGGKAELIDCEVWDAKCYGMMSEGTGSQLLLKNTKVYDSHKEVVVVANGGSLEAEHCYICRSHSGNGVFVYDNRSTAKITNTEILHHELNCVLVSANAKLEMTGCDVWGAGKLNGVLMAGEGTHGELKDCLIHENRVCNVGVDAGASVNVLDCKLYRAKKGSALAAKRKDSEATVARSKVYTNRVGDYVAVMGGRVNVDGVACKGGNRWMRWLKRLSRRIEEPQQLTV